MSRGFRVPGETASQYCSHLRFTSELARFRRLTVATSRENNGKDNPDGTPPGGRPSMALDPGAGGSEAEALGAGGSGISIPTAHGRMAPADAPEALGGQEVVQDPRAAGGTLFTAPAADASVAGGRELRNAIRDLGPGGSDARRAGASDRPSCPAAPWASTWREDAPWEPKQSSACAGCCGGPLHASDARAAVVMPLLRGTTGAAHAPE